jgi:hypothetical protein
VLLDAVVEIAFDLAALFVGSSHEAPPRTFEVSERVVPARFECRVLGGEQRHGTGCLEQLRIVVELR